MAERRSSDWASPRRSKPLHSRSRRSPSTPLSRSPHRNSSASLSPRSKRTRRAREANSGRDLDGGKDRDSVRKDYSRGRERDSDRDRHKDVDRVREKERDGERIRDDYRGRGRTGNRDGHFSRDRSREKKARERESPGRSRHPRSSSPRNAYKRHSHSPPRRKNVSPSHHHKVPDRHPDTSKNENAAATVIGHDGEKLRAVGEEDSVKKMEAAEAALEAKQKEKEKPSFEYSGKLAAETNRVRGVTLVFTEPPEARKPTIRWRLYIFKDGEPLKEPLYIHRQSCYLFGRERRIADVPTDHLSCSKQHAVIQYRLTEKLEADGSGLSIVRPYLMDLGSTNGTLLNGERLEPHRYYELYEKDTIRFGNSSREYVLLHENSAG